MPDPVKLEVPVDQGKNVELKKYYTFNETGNQVTLVKHGSQDDE